MSLMRINETDHPSLEQSRKCFLLALLCAAVCLLPYLFPVTPTVSRSYVAGFSNRAAVVIFIFGAWIFALITRGHLVAPSKRDSRLRVSALFAGWGTGLLVCFLRLRLASNGFLGGES